MSGRGVIYPLKSIIEAKGLNSKIFPHYYGDYSLSMKINIKGYKLIVSLEAIVFTNEDFKYFGSDGYSFIPFENTTPIIGGISKQSILVDSKSCSVFFRFKT